MKKEVQSSFFRLSPVGHNSEFSSGGEPVTVLGGGNLKMDSPLFLFSKRPFISEYEVSPEPEVLFLPW